MCTSVRSAGMPRLLATAPQGRESDLLTMCKEQRHKIQREWQFNVPCMVLLQGCAGRNGGWHSARVPAGGEGEKGAPVGTSVAIRWGGQHASPWLPLSGVPALLSNWA